MLTALAASGHLAYDAVYFVSLLFLLPLRPCGAGGAETFFSTGAAVPTSREANCYARFWTRTDKQRQNAVDCATAICNNSVAPGLKVISSQGHDIAQ